MVCYGEVYNSAMAAINARERVVACTAFDRIVVVVANIDLIGFSAPEVAVLGVFV